MKFYSEKLDKLFDTEKELKAEEAAAEKAALEKEQAKAAKKEEAKAVELAFQNRNAAVRTYNENVAKLKKNYNEDVFALKQKFDAAVKAETTKVDEAEEAYDSVLSAFIERHPEGYHMTLKDGDNVVTLSSTSGTEAVDELFNPEKFWDNWLKLFRI